MNETKRQIRSEKIRQAYALMDAAGIDAWLFLAREGSDPAFGFLFGVHTIHTTAIVLERSGVSHVFCSASDYGNYIDATVFSRVCRYDDDVWAPLQAFLAALPATSLALNISEQAHLADGLTVGLFDRLSDMLPEPLARAAVSSEALLIQLRAVKTAREQALIEAAVKTTEAIYAAVFDRIRCGMSEREIGQLFVREMAARGVSNGVGGAQDPPIVCLVREGLAHRAPGDGQSRPGDVLVMDFSVRQDGYVSDIARTGYFLRPGETAAPPDVEHAFRTAVNAVTAVLGQIRPGLAGYEVDAVGRKVVEDGGYPTIRHSVGHQVGTACHDGGTILGPRRTPPRPEVEAVLQVGEVYAIEPTVIQDGGLPSIIVEENGVLTDTGIRLFSERQTELVLFPCGAAR